jgi:hypothetical protein
MFLVYVLMDKSSDGTVMHCSLSSVSIHLENGEIAPVSGVREEKSDKL